jgi:hypothetical protein
MCSTVVSRQPSEAAVIQPLQFSALSFTVDQAVSGSKRQLSWYSNFRFMAK